MAKLLPIIMLLIGIGGGIGAGIMLAPAPEEAEVATAGEGHDASQEESAEEHAKEDAAEDENAEPNEFIKISQVAEGARFMRSFSHDIAIEDGAGRRLDHQGAARQHRRRDLVHRQRHGRVRFVADRAQAHCASAEAFDDLARGFDLFQRDRTVRRRNVKQTTDRFEPLALVVHLFGKFLIAILAVATHAVLQAATRLGCPVMVFAAYAIGVLSAGIQILLVDMRVAKRLRAAPEERDVEPARQRRFKAPPRHLRRVRRFEEITA